MRCLCVERKSCTVSEIEQYLRCPRGYYLRCVAKERRDVSPFVAVSTSLRETITLWHRARSSGGSVGSAGNVVDLFRSLVAVKGYRARAAELVKAAEPALISYVMGYGTRLEDDPESNSVLRIGLQKEVRLACGWTLRGEIPLASADGTIADIRVCMNAKRESDVARDFRLGAFAFLSVGEDATEEEDAASQGEVCVEMEVLVIGRRPRAQRLRGTCRAKDLVRLRHVVELAADGISRHAFPPTHPGNWNCSPRWCAYYGPCTAGMEGEGPHSSEATDAANLRGLTDERREGDRSSPAVR